MVSGVTVTVRARVRVRVRGRVRVRVRVRGRVRVQDDRVAFGLMVPGDARVHDVAHVSGQQP